jgi:hypothetical protein
MPSLLDDFRAGEEPKILLAQLHASSLRRGAAGEKARIHARLHAKAKKQAAQNDAKKETLRACPDIDADRAGSTDAAIAGGLNITSRGRKSENRRSSKTVTPAKTEAEAWKVLRLRHGEIAGVNFSGPKAERVTFEELAEGLFRDYESNGNRSLRSVRIKVEKHLLPFFRGKRAQQITTAEVRSLVAERQAAGASNADINRELAALKRMFNLALQEEKISRKPYFGKRLPETNVRRVM